MCTHLPALCPHCAMGQNVLQNIRRAVLTEAVRFWCHGFMSSRHMGMVRRWQIVVCVFVFGTFICVVFQYFCIEQSAAV